MSWKVDEGSEEQTPKTDASPTEHQHVQQTTSLDWSNPQSWKLAKKLYHIVPVVMIVFAVALGSSIITAGAFEIEKDFHMSSVASALPFSIFVLGLGFGPIIGAPLSETIGRSLVYKVTGVLLCLFLVASALSPDFASLLVFRFLAGAAGGPSNAITGGTTADLFPEHLRANTMTLLLTAGFLGAAVGPVVGGYTAEYKGWRWTQWVALIIAGVAVVLMLPTQETYAKIVSRRQERRRNRNAQAPSDHTSPKSTRQIMHVVLLRSLHMLAVEPIVTLFSLYNAFGLGVLYGFFAAYPAVFRQVYGFTAGQGGLTFLSIAFGIILAGITATIIQWKMYLPRHRKAGSAGLPPESRLYGAMIGGFGIPVGLFWFAWTARPSIHWISPVLAGIPFAWGNLCVVMSAVFYFVNVYGSAYSASALAANGIARYTVAAMFPLFSQKMFDSLGVAWAASLLGFISIALLPIPFVFYRYGPRIRAKSKYVGAHLETSR